MKKEMYLPKKWWQIANNENEFKLFDLLARGQYKWISIRNIIKELDWDINKLKKVSNVFIENGIIILNPKIKVREDSKLNNELYMAYWENLDKNELNFILPDKKENNKKNNLFIKTYQKKHKRNNNV